MKDLGFAKELLRQCGVKAYKKDIDDVEIHELNRIQHEVARGKLPPDVMAHRQIVLVTMKDGIVYKILRETVDRDGDFSTVSAKWQVKDFRQE